MATLNDLESWKTLLNAATVRYHEPILEIAKTLEEEELFLTIGNAVAYLRRRETSTSYLNWMPKREQILIPPTVADLPSDNPRPILVEFFSGFTSFAKRINTPGTLVQGRN